MRRPKHRRHPDIWRARHLALKSAERHWWDTPNGRAAHDFWRAINGALLMQDAIVAAMQRGTLKPAPRTRTEAEFLATLRDVWNESEPPDMATPYLPGRVR